MTWAAFERNAYQAARSWGIQPSEFWQLPVADWWVELDAKLVEARQMEERLDQAKTGKSARGAFTNAEWDAARKKHAEKMKAMQ